jgi:hypothetical protein
MTHKHLHHRLVWWLALLMLLPVMARASTPESLAKLEALLRQQDYPTAWQQATELLTSQEGEPRFDYLYALAARGTGHLHQAVFALERALQSEPQSLDIRLALAVSYFELGNLPAAERELRQLEKTALPEDASRLVHNYLQRISSQQDPSQGYWQNWLQVNAGSDTNPNSGVDDEFVLIPLLGQVRLFEQSREQSSSFTELQAQLNWTLPRDQHSAFYLSAALLHGTYSEDSVFSRTYASAVAGYQTRWQGYKLLAELFYRPIRLDGDSYLDYQGIKTTISRPINTTTELGLDLTYARQRYTTLLALDKTHLQAESWLSTRSGKAEHKFHLRWGQENSDVRRTDFNSRDYLGLGYRWQQMLSDQWLSNLSLDYLSGAYDEPHPLFAELRDDSYYKAELELSYKFDEDWRVLATLSHLRNNSSIAIYQYRRSRGGIGVRYAF